WSAEPGCQFFLRYASRTARFQQKIKQRLVASVMDGFHVGAPSEYSGYLNKPDLGLSQNGFFI
ncbi:hypothetical protein APX70_01942, partial [Pseudomonas syringae pv. maculicola]